MAICSIRDVNRVVDNVFIKNTTQTGIAQMLPNGSIQLDFARATEKSNVTEPKQVHAMAERIQQEALQTLINEGLSAEFIDKHKNQIVEVLPPERLALSPGKDNIWIVKKNYSPEFVQYMDTIDGELTVAQEFENQKREILNIQQELQQENEVAFAEYMGLTREEYFDMKYNTILKPSELSQTALNESTALIYDNELDKMWEQYIDSAPTYSMAPAPVQNFLQTRFDNYVKFKENLLLRVERKINQLKKMKKDTVNNTKLTEAEKKSILKQLAQSEDTLLEYRDGNTGKQISGLKNDIDEIKRSKDVNRIIFSAQNDIARVKYLSNSENPESLQEAKEIINFYKAAQDFTNSAALTNPLFFSEDIVNEFLTSNVPDSVKEAMRQIYEDVEPYETIINTREKEVILKNLNNLEQIKNNPDIVNRVTGTISYDDIFFKNTGLKDITMAEMWLYSPSATLLRDDGIVPKGLELILENSYNKANIFTKDVVSRIDALLPRVSKVLKDMGEHSKVFGKGVVSWEIFRAKDANGLSKDGIVQRYSSEFIDAFADIKDKYQNQIRKALAPTVDPLTRTGLLQTIHKDRDKWLRENTMMIDPRKIKSIHDQFSIYGNYIDDGGAHENALKALLGEKGFNEEVARQVELMKQYETALSMEKDKLSSLGGVAYLSKLQQWENRNNPFIAAENFEKQTYPTRGSLIDYTNLKFSSQVPLDKKGYYDENFKTIESNDDLKEFHDLLMEVINTIQQNLTPELQEKLSTTSLPTLAKSIHEIFSDPHLNLKAKMSEAFRRFMDFVRSLFTINPQSDVDSSIVDLVTGKKMSKVNSSFLKGAKAEIDRTSKLVIDQFRSIAKLPLSETKAIKNSWNSLTDSERGFLDGNLHPKQLIQIKNAPNEVFDLSKMLKDNVTNDIINNNSFDLPKIIKAYTALTMNFAAREAVKAPIELMIEHYKLIQNPETTQQGGEIKNKKTGKVYTKGERKHAIARIENWFNRSVLDNRESRNEFGSIKSLERDVLSPQEKALKKEYEDIIAKLEKEANSTKEPNEKANISKKIHYYQSQINLLGRRTSLTALTDSIFSWVRLLGLGWNVKSQITNLMEGQIANQTYAATGTFFNIENFTRANGIVKGSFVKNLTFGGVSLPGAKKASTLMKRFEVMQDATDELQKAATNKNPLESTGKFFAPFTLINRVEYVNQTPVVLAILMENEITGKDGTKSNVWDAMLPNGELQDNFKTEDNVANWEQGKGEQYDKFVSLVRTAISTIHGDYSKITGNMATETIIGKAMLMFKRWATAYIAQRFAVEHNVLVGKDYVKRKGRARSHSTFTGAVSGAMVGAVATSAAAVSLGMTLPALLTVGAPALVGGFIASRYGINKGGKDRTKQVLGTENFIQEALMTMKYISLKMIGIPINSIAGKYVIKHNPELKGDADRNLAIDARNYKANITEITLQLALLMMAGMVKAAFGDEEEDKWKYNLLANNIGKLLNQTTMVFNIIDTKSLIMDFAVFRWGQNLWDLTVQTALLTGSEPLPVMKSGPYKGSTKLEKAAKSMFLPSLLRDKNPLKGGFATDMDKYYEYNMVGIVGKAKNQGAEGDAKDEIKRLKDQLLKQYIPKNLSEKEKKEREKMINKLFSKNSKRETYTEMLEDIQQFIDALSQTYGPDGDPSLMEDMPSKREVEERFEIERDLTDKTPPEEEIEEDEDIDEE